MIRPITVITMKQQSTESIQGKAQISSGAPDNEYSNDDSTELYETTHYRGASLVTALDLSQPVNTASGGSSRRNRG